MAPKTSRKAAAKVDKSGPEKLDNNAVLASRGQVEAAPGIKSGPAPAVAAAVSGPQQAAPRRSRRVAARAPEEQSSAAEDAPGHAELLAAEEQPEEVPADAGLGGQGAEEDDEQSTEEEGAAQLDAFEGDTREAVDAFEAAVADPATFLRPSAEVSELARRAAKVSLRSLS